MQRRIGIPLLLTTLFWVLGFMPLSVKAAAYDDVLKQLVTVWQNSQTGRPFYQDQKSSLQGKIVVIDPGHGGSDTGAIGPHNVREKDVVLAISKELRNLLAGSGATVIMTRMTDTDVAYAGASDKEELAARVAIANDANADLFVSIHANASDDGAGGTTTYAYDTETNRLAPLVQTNLVTQLNLYNRGVQQEDFYVLKNTNMPSILTEAAFITESREERLLTNRNFDKQVALGIYNGIKQYFGRY